MARGLALQNWGGGSMLADMEAVMCLRSGVRLVDTLPLLRRFGVKAVAMHPGVNDPALALWHVLTGPDEQRLRQAVAALQSHPGVDAALIKPSGEAPLDGAPG